LKPNFIVVIDDDLNTRSLAELPEIVSIMGEAGARFRNAFATCSLCGPSRVSFLTGRYPHNHGITDNAGSSALFRESPSLAEDCLPVWMKRAGYRTSLVGKWLNNYQDAAYIPPGWDEWYGMLGRFEQMRVSDNGTETTCPDHTDVTYARRAADVVRRSSEAGDPFFLWIGVNAPHDPPEVEPRYAGEFADSRVPRTPSFNARGENEVSWLEDRPPLTDEQIEWTDENHRERLRAMLSVRDLLARLVDELAATGRLESTYVFFTSDHGYHQGQHRLLPGKMTAFDEDLRIPMMVRGPSGPEGVVAGQVREELVANNDLAPTILDLAGVPASTSVDGRSFAPLLRGESVQWRRFVGVEGWHQPSRNPVIPPTPDYHGVRSQLYKFVRYDTGETEWYRLDNDPHELRNKPASHNPAGHEALSRAAAEIHVASGAACRSAED
jgi:arylsulfatase A-like enzyme